MADGVELALGAMVFYGLADWVYKRAAANNVRSRHSPASRTADGQQRVRR